MSKRSIVVIFVVDSHIQCIVLATEETTATTKSAIDLSDANLACGHKELRRSTGRIMVTTLPWLVNDRAALRLRRIGCVPTRR